VIGGNAATRKAGEFRPTPTGYRRNRHPLGQAFARLCEVRGIPYYLLSRQEMDITNPSAVEQTLTELKPWAVVNATGYVRVDDAEKEPHLCHRLTQKVLPSWQKPAPSKI
jgi:dTDP-4-dehydrorhamnose reductase